MKECIKCSEVKDLVNFYKHPTRDGDTVNTCKPCYKERVLNNTSKNKVKRASYMKSYYKANKDKILERGRVRDNEKRSSCSIYKLRYNLSHNLRESLKRSGRNKKNSISEVVGCSMEDLVEKLNDNPYGLVLGAKGVDIDHITPTSSASNEEEMLSLYNYTNLQLLPSYYNRHIKRDKEFNKLHFEEWLREK